MTDGPEFTPFGNFTPYKPQHWVFSDILPACELCGNDATGQLYGCKACYLGRDPGLHPPSVTDMPICRGHIDMILLDTMVNG